MTVGIDLIEIARVRRTLERYPSFRERCFTAAERAYCDSRPNPPQHYTAEEMKAAEAGHDVEALMERAGSAVAAAVARDYPGARVVAVCGKGATAATAVSPRRSSERTWSRWAPSC